MIRKMFGETPEEQLKYLQPRLIITAIGLVVGLVPLLFGIDGSVALLAIVALMWGWSFLKAGFGLTSIAAIFSGNFVLGIIIFVLFLSFGYFLGIIVFVIGLCRFVQLKTKPGDNV